MRYAQGLNEWRNIQVGLWRRSLVARRRRAGCWRLSLRAPRSTTGHGARTAPSAWRLQQQPRPKLRCTLACLGAPSGGPQDIVRLTFKAFHDVLRAQGDSIKSLERNVDTKAGRAEVATSLQQKANSIEMAGRLREVRTGAQRRGAQHMGSRLMGGREGLSPGVVCV